MFKEVYKSTFLGLNSNVNSDSWPIIKMITLFESRVVQLAQDFLNKTVNGAKTFHSFHYSKIFVTPLFLKWEFGSSLENPSRQGGKREP